MLKAIGLLYIDGRIVFSYQQSFLNVQSSEVFDVALYLSVLNQKLTCELVVVLLLGVV